MKTSIIIPVCNGLELTKKCIESIKRHTHEQYEIIIIDNNSTDGTPEYLKGINDIKIISNIVNQGFAKSCNQGIKIASGDNILLLNNDIIVTKNWLANMIKILYSDGKTAMVGPVSNNVSGYQQIPVNYRNFSGNNITDGDIEKINEFAAGRSDKYGDCFKTVRRLVGFCLLIKKSVLNDIGYFDERFGLGNYEDDDLCYRAFLKGYNLKIALGSFVHHIGHATFNRMGDAKLAELLNENRKKIADKWGFDITSFLHRAKVNITISLCMIVKDEEKTLPRCLDSISGIADEIIIVDTGSTDNTKIVASKYTDKIYDFKWIDDFAAARNFAFGKAAKEYILWLDADDILENNDRLKLLSLKSAMDSSVDSVTMNYNLSFDANGSVISSLRRNRLVRRACFFKWVGFVHEYLSVWGNIINSDISVNHKSIEHDSNRNLMIYEKHIQSGEEFTPRDLYYYANELSDHGIFGKAVQYYEKFLNTGQGWVEDNISACGRIADCYKNLKDSNKEFMYTLKSFEYGLPRAEFCCRLGYHFLNRRRYKEAIFWYKLATELEIPSESWGTIDHACWTWLPHLQLCVCYDRLGQYETACKHNEIAAKYIPDSPQILYNRKYFEKIKK